MGHLYWVLFFLARASSSYRRFGAIWQVVLPLQSSVSTSASGKDRVISSHWRLRPEGGKLARLVSPCKVMVRIYTATARMQLLEISLRERAIWRIGRFMWMRGKTSFCCAIFYFVHRAASHLLLFCLQYHKIFLTVTLAKPKYTKTSEVSVPNQILFNRWVSDFKFGSSVPG